MSNFCLLKPILLDNVFANDLCDACNIRSFNLTVEIVYVPAMSGVDITSNPHLITEEEQVHDYEDDTVKWYKHANVSMLTKMHKRHDQCKNKQNKTTRQDKRLHQ